MRGWPWPGPSSGVLYSLEFLQEYSVVPTKMCAGVLHHSWKGGDLLSFSMLEVAEEEEVMTSLSPAEETGFLDEESEPWEE